MLLALVAAVALAALALAPSALARGGSYTITGSTSSERATIVQALDASAFDWSVVPGTITIQVVAGAETSAFPGAIILDANLVDSGTFAWGIIQHEYAHQVDFFLLRPELRALIGTRLGGSEWGAGITLATAVSHDDQTGERFADLLTWSFWPSPLNAIEPRRAGFSAKGFRGYLGALLRPDTGSRLLQASR